MDAAPYWLANSELSWHPSFLQHDGFADAHLAVEWPHMGSYYLDAANTARYPGLDVLHLRIGGTIRGVSAWLHLMTLPDPLYPPSPQNSSYGTFLSAERRVRKTCVS